MQRQAFLRSDYILGDLATSGIYCRVFQEYYQVYDGLQVFFEAPRLLLDHGLCEKRKIVSDFNK